MNLTAPEFKNLTTATALLATAAIDLLNANTGEVLSSEELALGDALDGYLKARAALTVN